MATTTAERHSGRKQRQQRRQNQKVAATVLSSTAAVSVLLLSSQAAAAEWRIHPTLDLRETYTDNVRLAAKGAEKSDFVTEISPGLSIVNNGPRVKFKADYAFRYLKYANDGKGDSSYHSLNAATNMDLVRNLLGFDGSAAISRQDVSLNGPLSTNTYAITDNLSTVKSITASPYLHHDFHGVAQSELRYTHTSVSTESDLLSSSRSDGLRFNIDSDPSFRTLGWGLSANVQRDSLANSNPVNSSSTTGRLRYMVTPHLYLTATAGYDKYNYATAAGEPAPQGNSYSAGFSWRPTERTSLAATVGEKFYGRTYSLDSSVRSRASLWRLSYDETITTAPAQLALASTTSTSDFLNQLFRSSIPDDAQRQQAVDRFILSTGLPATLTRSINYLSRQFFLQKTLRASVAITGAKNTVMLTAFNVSRLPQSATDPTQPALPATLATEGDTRQTGLNALWNWRITPLTSATFNADYTRSKTVATGVEERLKTVRAALTRRLQPHVDGMLEVRHTEQDSDTPANTHDENAVSAYVSMKF